MAKKLITLDSHNKSRQEIKRYPAPNGIECPKCKEELLDLSNEILLTTPPKKRVKCSNIKCDYAGYRIA